VDLSCHLSKYSFDWKVKLLQSVDRGRREKRRKREERKEEGEKGNERPLTKIKEIRKKRRMGEEMGLVRFLTLDSCPLTLL